MGSKKSTTTTTHDVPDYLENASKTAVNLGTKIADQRYTPYEGDRFADLHSNEQTAINLASTGGKNIESSLQKAGDQLAGIKTFDQADLSGYMNPYVDQVNDATVRNLNAAAGRQQRNLSSKMGAGGGSGEILGQSAINQNLMQNIGDATAKGRSEAFGQAVQAWKGDQDLKLRASAAWRDTAGDVSKMNSQQIGDLMKTGEAARVVSQLDKDFDYQQFTEARDWDLSRLGPLLQSMSGPHDSKDTTVTKKKSGIGQIIGAAAVVAGAIFAPVTGGASLAVGTAVNKAANG